MRQRREEIIDRYTLERAMLKKGVISYAALDIEGLYTSSGASQVQRVKLTKYFNEGTCIDWLILLPDADKTSYDGCGTISSLAPVRDASKKNRIKLKLAISGEVKERQDGDNVLDPTDTITLPTV